MYVSIIEDEEVENSHCLISQLEEKFLLLPAVNSIFLPEISSIA
jgi:hypothetical protein